MPVRFILVHLSTLKSHSHIVYRDEPIDVPYDTEFKIDRCVLALRIISKATTPPVQQIKLLM